MLSQAKENDLRVTRRVLLLVSLLTLALACACSIQEKKGDSGDKKVDIKVPFAEIHVGSDSDARDTGLASYPGARSKSDSDGDKNRANVQIGGEDFGVKVVAATYLSDDSPQKVIDFYRKDLGRYGKVLECPKGIHENHDSKDGDHGELRCDDHGSTEEGKLDLAVGVPDRQRIVSVKPNGKGSEFSLVYVQIKGKTKETL